MAEQYAARKDGAYKVVGIAPDACFTPGIPTPVPYPVTTTLGSSKSTVDSVNFNGHPAFIFDRSFVPVTIGDAAGSNKGVVSGTVEGDCWSLEHSPDTFIGGSPLNRINDLFAMNGKAVGGRGGAAITKHEAWERRKALIDKGKQSSDAKVRAAAERLELNNAGVEKARLADYVYEPRDATKPTPPIPEGWNDISDDAKALSKYGLKSSDLEIEGQPGFRSRVYVPDKRVFADDMSASVVFRGTRMPEWIDWKNNLQQGIGLKSEYYKEAVKIGTLTRNSAEHIDIVGHSLGGGLASAASQASGKPGWTYNAAGLKSGTVEKYGGTVVTPKGTENINAYRVNGEVLTSIQEPGFWGGAALIYGFGALGAGVVMAPKSVGIRHDMEGGTGSTVSKHGMDQVLHCIELEKHEDESILLSQ
ncbi:DUF4150 domain-containing protein [Erwinia tasmaniensis]|uniref:Propable Phospholipase A1 n=1 Tax=Erwinia tasmaniensis (strain DSM 17950 / CFBP 7177 / CIP 109463 / NCPPB 4357 / Et1/99) TaxID=465817 RepID=B2VH66_ERWT9|nr:DUF4150 domain-containing protein [Erwinia tasmaniensis]CAO95689.1 Propable Phospholipase A1 [Erwinia tasmaniensis Et1/99]